MRFDATEAGYRRFQEAGKVPPKRRGSGPYVCQVCRLTMRGAEAHGHRLVDFQEGLLFLRDLSERRLVEAMAVPSLIYVRSLDSLFGPPRLMPRGQPV